MTMSLLSLFSIYSLCWYGVFHLATKPPTENALVYYLSLFHLVLSFAYLLFIYPLNRLDGSKDCLVETVSSPAMPQIRELPVDKSNWIASSQQSQLHKNLPAETSSHGLDSTDPSSEGKLKNADEITLIMNQSFDNALHRKARLIKSGSFPAATSSHIRCQEPTKLDHKQGEIWPTSQGMESAHGSKDSLAQSMTSLSEDSEGSSQRTISSSKGKLQLNKLASSRMESADRYSQLYETRSRTEIKRYASRSFKLAAENDETKPRVFRRGSSLSELEYNSFLPNTNAFREAISSDVGSIASSAEYPELDETSSRKEIKRCAPRCLKVVIYNDGTKPRVFRRGFSLSELEYNSFLPNMDAFGEALASVLGNVAGSADQPELSVNTKDGSSGNLGKNGENIIENAAGRQICTREQRDENTTDVGCNERGKPGSVLDLEAPCEEDEMCSINLFTSEVTFTDCESGNQSQSTIILEKGENVKIPEDDHFSPIELADDENNTEFYYVKHVLELSGFIGREHHCTWYSFEQPLNPDLFEEIERQYCNLGQPQSSTENEERRWVRKLIFVLINEALVYINEKPYLYYPNALSSKCHIYPIPKGKHLLDEVWALVGRSLSWRPNLDALLVAYDLNPNDGWMNLQIDSECAALEVEDLILDELLDDVLATCLLS